MELGCRKGATVLAAMSVREMGDRRRASTTAMEARARDRLDSHDIVCSLGTWFLVRRLRCPPSYRRSIASMSTDGLSISARQLWRVDGQDHVECRMFHYSAPALGGVPPCFIRGAGFINGPDAIESAHPPGIFKNIDHELTSPEATTRHRPGRSIGFIMSVMVQATVTPLDRENLSKRIN